MFSSSRAKHFSSFVEIYVMQQLRLMPVDAYKSRTITFDHVRAHFTALTESVHEVILEVNSHKFLIRIKAGLKKLEQFEIVAVKGFVEVGMKIVNILKRIVSALYFEH